MDIPNDTLVFHGLYGIDHPNPSYDLGRAFMNFQSLLPSAFPFGYSDFNDQFVILGDGGIGVIMWNDIFDPDWGNLVLSLHSSLRGFLAETGLEG